MKNTLISLSLLLASVSFSNKVLAEIPVLTVTVDQTASSVTVVDSVGRKTVLPARTAMKGKKLDAGTYELDANLLPQCNTSNDGYCVLNSNVYSPKPEQQFATLAGWGEPNKGVALQMFFKPVTITTKFGAKLPKAKFGYVFIPAFHSEILQKNSKGVFSTPPESIVQGFATNGCIRLGYRDLLYLYTQFMYELGIKGKIVIIVKG